MALDEAELVRLNALADELLSFQSRWKESRYSEPVNLAEERQRVMDSARSGSITTPNFLYRQASSKSVELQADASHLLRLVDSDSSVWGAAVRDIVQAKMSEVEAFISHDVGKISSVSVGKFGLPSQDLISFAERVLLVSAQPEPIESSVRPVEAATHFKRVLEEANFDGWAVKVVNSMQARMAVDSSERLIKVSAAATFSWREVHRLVAHEIGTHALRSVNASRQQIKLLSIPLGVSEFTEEGLAVFNEARMGLLDITDLKKYALRVLAAHWSMESGFGTVLKNLLEYTDAQNAVEIAVRSKRGMKDLHAAGAHLKDLSYLAGYVEVHRSLEESPSNFGILMSAKQPLEMLPVLESLISEDQFSTWPIAVTSTRLPGPKTEWRSPDGDPFGLLVAASRPTLLTSNVFDAGSPGIGVDVASRILSGATSTERVQRFDGLRVRGDIDLDGTTIDNTIVFSDCAVTGKFSASNSRTRTIQFLNCKIGSIDLSQATVDSDLVIRGSRIGRDTKHSLFARGARFLGSVDADPLDKWGPTAFDGIVSLELAHVGGRIALRSAEIAGRKDEVTNGATGPIGLNLTRATASGGLRMRGAKVVGGLRGIGFHSGGQVNLTSIVVIAERALILQRASFDGTVLARGAEFHGFVDFTGSTLGGNLVLEGVKVGRDDGKEAISLKNIVCENLRLTGSDRENKGKELGNDDEFKRQNPNENQERTVVKGTLNITSATIRGNLVSDGLVVEARGTALDLSGTVVRGPVLARSMVLKSREGKALVAESSSSGSKFDLGGSALSGSLDLSNAQVQNSVKIIDAQLNSVVMVRLQVAEDVDLTSALFSPGARVDLSRAKISGTLHWLEIDTPPELILESASVKEIRDERHSWPAPGLLDLRSIKFERAVSRLAGTNDEVRDRLEWISRQKPFSQDPYHQLASSYRDQGNEDASRRVLIELQGRLARLHSSPVRWLISVFWVGLTGNGYRLGRVVALAAAVILMSIAAAFFAGSMSAVVPTDETSAAVASICDSTYPCFNWIAYGMDTVMPFLGLEDGSHWVPDRSRTSGSMYDGVRVVLILLGWITIGAAAGGLAQRYRR